MLLVSFLLRLSSFLHYPFSFRLPPFTCLLSPSSFHLPLSSILLFPSSFPRPPFPLPLSSARSPLPASPLSFLITICWFCPPRFSLSLSLSLSLARVVFVRQTARATKAAVGTPAYVYDAATLKTNAEACLAFPHAYGLTVRYAMKSLPNKAVLQLFNRCSARLGVQPTNRSIGLPTDRPTDRLTYRPEHTPA